MSEKKPIDVCNGILSIKDPDDIGDQVLDRVSCVFPDGSSYEGTAWGDLAWGNGVYKTEQGRIRYAGEWSENNRQGHGVLEIDREPFPGSEELRYSGQWKHGRIHGCGVFEVNDRSTSKRYYKGRFYYGKYMEEDHGCDDVSELHSRMAEVAAAKAQMFVNKPDAVPDKVEEKPLGNEELFENLGKQIDEKKKERSFLERMLTSVQDKWKVMFENLEKQIDESKLKFDKWKVMVENLEKQIDEKNKESELLKLKMIETDMEIVESESEMKEIIKEKDDELKRLEKEEEKKMEMELEDEDQVVEEAWKESKLQTTSCPSSSQVLTGQCTRISSVGYKRTFNQGLTLRACHKVNKCITRSSLGNIFKKKCIHPYEELKYFYPCTPSFRCLFTNYSW